jgi:hypothetical protein
LDPQLLVENERMSDVRAGAPDMVSADGSRLKECQASAAKTAEAERDRESLERFVAKQNRAPPSVVGDTRELRLFLRAHAARLGPGLKP